MLSLVNRLLDWLRSLFWKEEMELTLVGLQYSGKTTFVNVIAVNMRKLASNHGSRRNIVMGSVHHLLDGLCLFTYGQYPVPLLHPATFQTPGQSD